MERKDFIKWSSAGFLSTAFGFESKANEVRLNDQEMGLDAQAGWNGKEVISGDEVNIWTGALENYTFFEKNGNTLLSVDLDSNQQFKSYFTETWPKALNKLKSICER